MPGFSQPLPLALRALLLALLTALPGAAQTLEIHPDELDLGPVRPGASRTGKVQLKNPGADALDVLVSVDGEGFSTAADTLHLQSGGRGAVEVRFAPERVGPHRGHLRLKVKTFFKVETFPVELRGEGGSAALSFHPAEGLDFGGVPTGQRARLSVQLNNSGPVALRFDSLFLEGETGAFALAAPPSGELAPGERAEVHIAFSPLRGGAFEEWLAVASPDVQGLRLALRGEGLAPRLALSPLPPVGLDFGQVELGQSERRIATLLNQGQAPLLLAGMDVQDADFSTARELPQTPLLPGERLEIPLLFRPRREGQSQGLLRLRSNDPENPALELPLLGEGRISPPHIEILNGDGLDFGSVPVGKAARDHLLMWNRGGSPYTLRLQLEESGEFALETTSLLLQPGASAKVGVDFTPKEVGVRQVGLALTTPLGEQVLHLHGVGKFLKLSPAAVDLGRVAVGETTSQIVEIANAGNADLTINRIRSTSDEFAVHTQIDPTNRLLLPANSLRALPVNISFSPSARGPVSGVLRLEGYWAEGNESLDILLSGTGVAAEIELHPSGPVDFGFVVLGREETRGVVATNTGDTDLQVEAHSETREAWIEPTRFALAPGESTRLNISFRPEALGERFGQILLVSNDVRDRAQPLQVKGHGALESIDLTRLTRVLSTRKSRTDTLAVRWNNAPLVQKDGTKIDIAFDLPDSLRKALVGREILVEWTPLDHNYDPKGNRKQVTVKIYEADEGSILAEDFNLRLLEKSNRRARVEITTQSYPGGPPQKISQVFEAGGWKWEFEAKPLVSFLTIRPGRDYKDGKGQPVKGRTERLIGLPGIAFAGWHNVDNPFLSGVHFTAIGNVLEALSTENSIAVSLGVALSLYKDQFLFGFGWDIYDSRPRAKRKGSQDYIFTFKYSGLFK